MFSPDEAFARFTRRTLLRRSAMGAGSLALSSLLSSDAKAADKLPKPHFAPKAKKVLFIYLIGAPSHVDLFDPKPELQRFDGQPIPASAFADAKFPFIAGTPNLLGSPYRFAKQGQCSVEISELLPKLSTVADDLTFIRTMQTEEVGHGAAELFFHTGFGRLGRPSFGCWASYGLGSMNENLPAYVVLTSGPTYSGSSTWGSGFLPSRHQGVKFRTSADPVFFLSNPPGVEASEQREVIDSVSSLNRLQFASSLDPEVETRIAQYEMAFRMQSSVPDLMDVSAEPEHVMQMYGAKPNDGGFASNCILARRMLERGVRFVQVCSGNWDHHEDIFSKLPRACKQVDQPIAALMQDLKQRGLLEDTLVICGGEFGRSPVSQAITPNGKKGKPGRDHHKDAFTIWLAGAGVKRGVTHGRTDDFGMRPVENAVHVHDLHATALHLLGLDHTKLTYRHQGRNFRLTDVHGKVVREILA